MELNLDVRRVGRVLLMAVTIVATAGLVSELGRYVFDMPGADYMVSVFSLSYEGNFPTWYSSAQLSVAAVLLFTIAVASRQAGRRFIAHWFVLGAAFLYISLDEVVTIHEKMNGWFDMDGALYYGWIIPAGTFVLVMGLSYLPFLKHLPARTRRRFIVAGCLYVGGALLMEIPLGLWRDSAGTSANLGYALIDFVEETMEMLGICLFITALVDHLGGAEGKLAVSFTRAAPRPAPARKSASPDALPPTKDPALEGALSS